MPLVGLNILFVTYMIAVIFTAWYGGVRPALFTTVVGYLVANLVFLEARDRFQVESGGGGLFPGLLGHRVLERNHPSRAAPGRNQCPASGLAGRKHQPTASSPSTARWNCTYRNRAAERLARGNRPSGGADLVSGDAGTGRSLAEVFPLAALES